MVKRSRVVGVLLRLIYPTAEIGEFEPVAVVLIVALHPAQFSQRLVSVHVQTLDADGAVERGIRLLVAWMRIQDVFVGCDGIFIPADRLINLPKQEGRTRPVLVIAHAFQALNKLFNGRIEVRSLHVQFAEREMQARLPSFRQLLAVQTDEKVLASLVVRTRRDQRARQPQSRLILKRGGHLDHLAEFLFRTHKILLVEVAFADQQECVVHPLRIGVIAKHVGALVDGRLKSLIVGTLPRRFENRDVNLAIDGLYGLLERIDAFSIGLLSIVKGVVVGGEVVVPVAEERNPPAPGEGDQQK